MYQSFFSYRGGLWFWVALGVSVLAIGVYLGHDPAGPPNGGTWLGYTLGTLGALLIVWLMWFGVRKRRYRSNLGTVRGWLSAHVYLGIALLVVATLHAGFQLGWNVHTLLYALMCTVVVSGCFGVWAYLKYPALLTENAGGKTRDALFQEVAELDKQIKRQGARIGGDLETAVGSAIDRTVVGGAAAAQLRAQDGSQVVVPGGGVEANPGQQRVIDVLVGQLSRTSDREQTATMRELADLFGARARLLRRLRRDIQIQGLMRVWLYAHVPLSFATLAALVAHVFAVFAYW